MFALRVLHRDGALPTPDIRGMAAAMAPDGGCDLVQHRLRNDAGTIYARSGDAYAGLCAQVWMHEPTGVQVVCWAVLHRNGPTLATSCAQEIVQAYLHHGTEAPHHLRGDFAFVLHDPRRGIVIAARDPIGVRPLYYAQREHGIDFATSLPVLEAMATKRFRVREKWLALAVLENARSADTTCFEEARKVPPAHLLIWHEARLQVLRYHRFDPASAHADSRDPSWVGAYRDMLETAIARRLPARGRVALELSGGLDSSSVTALAARLLGARRNNAITFGQAFYAGETEQILACARQAGIRHNHILMGYEYSDFAEKSRRAIAVMGHPVEHSIAVGQAVFYQLAAQLGCRSILSGFGGDECVTQHAPNLEYELTAAGHWKALGAILPGNRAMRSIRVAKRRLRGARRPVNRAAPVILARYKDAPLRREAFDTLVDNATLTGEARDRIAFETVNDMAIAQLSYPYVSTRCESCTLMAASFGVNFAWPLLDLDLIDLWLATPSVEKRGPGTARFLHRRAMEGLLPDSIRLFPGKQVGSAMDGVQIPMPRSTPQSARLTVGRILESAGPALRAMLDPDALDRIGQAAGLAQGSAHNIHARRTLRDLEILSAWHGERT